MLVDDHVDTCDLMKALLEGRGHEVRAYVTGGTALAEIGPFAPEALVIDIQLPDMDGLDLVRDLRRMALSDPHRIIVLTADALPKTRQRALDAGADVFLCKPLSYTNLIASLETE